MGEYKISSADIAIRCDATIDDLIDVLEAKSRKYIPVIYALNKIDSISIEELDLLYRYTHYVGGRLQLLLLIIVEYQTLVRSARNM
jgi:uncharacterized protein